MLDYIYAGEVQLLHQDVDDFLDHARRFKVHGLDVEINSTHGKENAISKPMVVIPKVENIDTNDDNGENEHNNEYDINSYTKPVDEDSVEKNLQNEPYGSNKNHHQSETRSETLSSNMMIEEERDNEEKGTEELQTKTDEYNEDEEISEPDEEENYDLNQE